MFQPHHNFVPRLVLFSELVVVLIFYIGKCEVQYFVPITVNPLIKNSLVCAKLSIVLTHTHPRTHARMYAHTHTHTHTHTHMHAYTRV